MILAAKTADKMAEIVLFDKDIVAREEWLADREMAKGLLGQIETVLENNGLTWKDLTGLIAYKGPGSFTGLRIGLTTLNAVAYSLGAPIVGVQGDNWILDGSALLHDGNNHEMVVPEYGADPRITSPRK